MPEDFLNIIRALPDAKALAIAAYGESVAAFRYRRLTETARNDDEQALFAAMAEEEQGHYVAVQHLMRKYFPGSDFVLTAEDKSLVIVGPRIFDLSTDEARQQSMRLIYDSELQTGRFYAAVHETTSLRGLRPMFKEMADECVEHAARLKSALELDVP